MKLRSVNTHFWDDSYICELVPIEKLCFIYLITNSLSNLAGVYEISVKRISFDTGIKKETILNMLSRFSADNKIHYVSGFIILVNHLKNQNVNPSMQKNINETIENLPANIREFLDTLHTPCIHPVHTIPTTQNTLRQDKDKDEYKDKGKVEDEDKDRGTTPIINNHLPSIFLDKFFHVTNKRLSERQQIRLEKELHNTTIPEKENHRIVISALEVFADYQDDPNRNTFKYFLGIIKGMRQDYSKKLQKLQKQKEIEEAASHRLKASQDLANEVERTKTLSWELFLENKSLFDPKLLGTLTSLLSQEKYLEVQSIIYKQIEEKT